jgi:hypothetical protein
MNRDRLLVGVELASATCLTIGAASFAPALGWVTAGALGLLGAWRAAG